MSKLEAVKTRYKKQSLPEVRPGDLVRVHQRITEGNRERTAVFEGIIIRARKLGDISAGITVRRIVEGVGVERTFLLHSPAILSINVLKRFKVRKATLLYLREKKGKDLKLKGRELSVAAVSEEVSSAPADEEAAPEPDHETNDDAALTEISEVDAEDAEKEVVENTDGLAQSEERAGEEDEIEPHVPGQEEDEAAADSEGVQIGLDKAQEEDTRGQEQEKD